MDDDVLGAHHVFGQGDRKDECPSGIDDHGPVYQRREVRTGRPEDKLAVLAPSTRSSGYAPPKAPRRLRPLTGSLASAPFELAVVVRSTAVMVTLPPTHVLVGLADRTSVVGMARHDENRARGLCRSYSSCRRAVSQRANA